MRTHLNGFVAVALVVTTACVDTPTRATDPLIEEPLLARIAPGWRPGEQQPVVRDPAPFTWAIWEAGAGQELAQTFTPARNQFLGYVQLPIGCEVGTLLNVKVREGLDGPIVAEVNADLSGLIVDGSFRTVQLFNPRVRPHGARLARGTTYAIVLSAVRTPAAGTFATCGMSVGPAGNSYAGGEGYYRDTRFSSTWLRLPDGNPASDEDLAFITLVR